MTTQNAKDRRAGASWIIVTGRASAAAVVVAALWGLALPDASAQLATFGRAQVADTTDDDDGPFPKGPSLSTDSDVDRLLRRASEYIADDRFDLATLALQQALDDQYQVARREGLREGEGERTMALMKLPDDQWTPLIDDWRPGTGSRPFQPYRSVAHEVERLIRKLPPEGMEIYRLSADGKAQGLLEKARGGDAEQALSEAVWKYFNSAHGDEAAFQLGCLLMERRDFVGANRYFEKILREHPDLSVPRQQVLLRLAVVNARLGDSEAAEAALAQLNRLGRGSVSELALRLVTTDVAEQKISAGAVLAASKTWPMRLGSPARNGLMLGPGFPAKTERMQLHDTWRSSELFQPSPSSGTATAKPQPPVQIGRGRFVDPAATKPGVSVEDLIKNWRSKKWTPTSRMLMEDGRIYVKSYHYPPKDEFVNKKKPRVLLMCYDAVSGERKWWKSWIFEDQQTQQPTNPNLRYYRAAPQVSGDKPSTRQEVALFGDHISHAMSMVDGVLYTLEGDPGRQTSVDQFQRFRSTTFGVVSNRLFAWEPKTKRDADGKLIAREGLIRWHRGGDRDPETGDELPVVFCAAPIPFGSRLIVPVRDAGSLWLYAIEPKQIDDETWEAPTVWKTLLCDEPPGGVKSFATVGVAARGSDVYVGSGAGVVFAVDGATGVIRWATRYQRTGVQGGTGVNVPGRTSGMNIEGFDVDTVIPFEGKLIVLPSDHKRIFALDRRTGEPEYDPPSDGFRHVLGTAGRWLVLGGADKIMGFDMKTGKREWTMAQADSEVVLGRGCVTAEGVFVPFSDMIVRIDLTSGRRISEMHVPETGEAPLGNLYSNGQRLFALGIDRILALSSIEQLIAQLNKQVTAGDPATQLAARSERMWLLAKMGSTDAAIADLRFLVAAEAKKTNPAAGLELLVRQIGVMQLTSKAGLDSFDLLMSTPGSWSEISPDGRQQRLAIIEAGLRAIGTSENSDTKSDARQHRREISLLLKLIAQDPPRHLLVAAQRVLRSTIRPDDASVIKEALKSENVSLRVSVVGALVTLDGAKAADTLVAALGDNSDRVRIEASRGLADVGDRRSLAAFVELLSSDDAIVRGKAVASLRAVSSQQFGFVLYAQPEARKPSVEKWRVWVEKEGPQAKLERSRDAIAVELGRLLIAIDGHDQLMELADDGTQTFLADDIRGASACQGLPNGYRLVASRKGRLIKVFDETDRLILNASVPGGPTSIERLKNEHILVACGTQVVEVDPAGRIIPVPMPKGTFLDARRVGEGRTLVAMLADGKGLIAEIDRSGEIVRKLAQAQRPVAVRRLPNGNTLVVDEEASEDGKGDAAQVVEYDPEGEVVWSKSGLTSPHDVQRLPNGNTLIVDNVGIKEFDPAGKLVWHRDIKMVRSAHRY